MRKSRDVERYMLCCLHDMQKMLAEKKNSTDEMMYAEPKKYNLYKLDDGKWQFEWENDHGHGTCTGDFDHCLRCVEIFKEMLIGKPRVTIDGAIKELASRKDMAISYAMYHRNVNELDKEKKAYKKASIYWFEIAELMRVSKNERYLHELVMACICSIRAKSNHFIGMMLDELERVSHEGMKIAKQVSKAIPRWAKKAIKQQRENVALYRHLLAIKKKEEKNDAIVEQGA